MADDAINEFFMSYSWYSCSIHVSDKSPADGGLQNKLLMHISSESCISTTTSHSTLCYTTLCHECVWCVVLLDALLGIRQGRWSVYSVHFRLPKLFADFLWNFPPNFWKIINVIWQAGKQDTAFSNIRRKQINNLKRKKWDSSWWKVK